MNSHTIATSALNQSTLLSSAALGDLSPSMQACYENAYAKLSRGVAIFPSEVEALEDRLVELWHEAIPDPWERQVAALNYGLVVALHRARSQPRPLDNIFGALLVVNWLLLSEELRAHPARSAAFIDLAADLGGGWDHDNYLEDDDAEL